MKKLALFIMVAVSLALLCGCATAIGFGIGYAADHSEGSKTRIASALPLEPGETITAVLKDSTSRTGQYDGYCGPGSSGDTTGTATNILPYYGEPVEIVDTLGAAAEYTFGGFFYRQVEQTWIPYMAVSNNENLSKQVDLNSIRELRKSDGIVIGQSQIQNAFAGMRVPPLSCLIIRNSLLAVPISLDEIDHLEAPLKKRGAERGLIIGLVADVIFWTTVWVLTYTNWPSD